MTKTRTMNRPGRAALAAATLAAVLLLPGCPAWTRFCKMIWLCPRPSLVTPELPPPDFEFVLHGDNLRDPPIDYLLKFNRNGQAEYSVTEREPRRITREGRFEVMEDQIFKLWDAIRAANYSELAPRFPDEGDGPDTALGIQRYKVHSEGMEKEVQAHYFMEPALDALRITAISLVPESVLGEAVPGFQQKRGTLGKVIGDTETKRFYAPESPLLADVPEERRREFRDWYEALNFGFDPGADWGTPRGTDR